MCGERAIVNAKSEKNKAYGLSTVSLLELFKVLTVGSVDDPFWHFTPLDSM